LSLVVYSCYEGYGCYSCIYSAIYALRAIQIQKEQEPVFLMQSLYFPEGHPRAGIFKGMVTILEERGYEDVSNIRAECRPNFSCEPGAQRCCCRRMLYNEPDFTNIKSTLELACASHEISVLFLPKFHCELSFIEQCWGHAKRTYRLQPPSTSEEALEKNLVNALESVTTEQMRK
jgi:hypothetical protein